MSNTASGVASAVKADWTFKIEMLDSDDNAIETVDSDGNVVANLVAGETELTLRFTATYTVGTENRGTLTSLWSHL